MISVIVPVFNTAKYLHRCVDSIIDQTYKEIEIILIDDGSTDNSGRICDRFALKDNRVEVFHTENNGSSVARNIGIENSNGEFIFFVDSDDYIESNALQLLIDNQDGVDLIIGDFRRMKDRDVKMENNTSSHNKLLDRQYIIDYARSYLKNTSKFELFAHCWGRLFRSSIIKDNKLFFDANLYTFEGVAFLFSYLKYVEKVFFLDRPIYNYKVWEDYSSASMFLREKPEYLFGFRKALEEVLNYIGIDVDNSIPYAYVGLTIAQLVRCCGQINKDNQEKIYKFVGNLVNDKELQEGLRFYSPSKGNSVLIPILIRLKLVRLLMWVCRRRANKRYGKTNN